VRSLVPALFLAAAVAYVGWYHEVYAPVRASSAPAETLVVPAGASVESIGGELHARGFVRHPLLFRAFVTLRGDAARLKAGSYELEGPLSLAQIVDLLERGQVARNDLTVPEGKGLHDIAVIVAARGVDAAAFLAAAADPAPIRDLDPLATDLEGYLFPDTYDIAGERQGAGDLVRRMVERFREVVTPLLPRIAESGLTLRQVVTLASLVELETAQAAERPRIAAVFHNRLRKGMALQTDPTVIYALRKAGTYDGNIRKKDLQIDSPYNTYKHPGLPPGPIASPGREAIEAVLAPDAVKDLYFVSKNDGTHQFSETLSQHEQAVTRYQRRRGSRS
jgi:UPF0755 protein